MVMASGGMMGAVLPQGSELLAAHVWEAAQLVAGEDTLEPRMTAVPVRLPYPAAPMQGSIYENQRDLGSRYFKDVDAAAAAAPT